jgi:hypothetical protein
MTVATAAPPAARSAWARNVAVPLREFLQTETSGGLVLLVAALVALARINSPWGSSVANRTDGGRVRDEADAELERPPVATHCRRRAAGARFVSSGRSLAAHRGRSSR